MSVLDEECHRNALNYISVSLSNPSNKYCLKYEYLYLLCLQDLYVPNSTLLQRLIRLSGILLHWTIVFSQFFEKRKRHDCMTSLLLRPSCIG